jgi:multisite-specific tRNA:(cytosine-C5)-methyltransferase
MRVYPYQQDTGAFFIAILEKRTEIRARPEEKSKVSLPSDKEEAMDITKDSTTAPTMANGSMATTPLDGTQAEASATATSQLKRKREGGDEDDWFDGKKPITLEQSGHVANETMHPSTIPREQGEAIGGDEDSMTNCAKGQAEIAQDDVPGSKTEDLDSSRLVPAVPMAVESNAQQASELPYKNKRKNGQPFEEPFKYLDPDMEELQAIWKFYNISPRFPRDRFMVRNATGTATKNIYYATGLAKSILQENEGKGMKFVHSGVKMFVKQDVPSREVCPWRIQTDGLPILEAWVGPERVVKLTKRETLRKLLIEMFPRFHGDDWENLGEIGEPVRDISMGCCVLRVEPTEAEDGLRYVNTNSPRKMLADGCVASEWCSRYGRASTL